MKEPKTIAALSYITILGWVIAFILHQDNKSWLGGYHLRQSLGLHVLLIASGLVNSAFTGIPALGVIMNFLVSVFSFALFILWVFGLINALSGEEKPLPVVGEFFQKIFSRIG